MEVVVNAITKYLHDGSTWSSQLKKSALQGAGQLSTRLEIYRRSKVTYLDYQYSTNRYSAYEYVIYSYLT